MFFSEEPLASDDEDVLPVRVPIIPRRGLVPFKRGRGRPKKVKFGDEFEETEPSAPLVCDFDNNCGFKTSKMSRMREHIASVHVTEVVSLHSRKNLKCFIALRLIGFQVHESSDDNL
jgi:hypothetical protein